MKPTEPGIYYDVPRETYDAIERVNWSWLKHMKRSPAHFRAARLAEPEQDSDAMLLGRAIHMAALEPERFRARWTVWDGGIRRGKAWETWLAKAEAGGLEVLTEDQYARCMRIADAVLTNEVSAKHLRGGHAEVTLLWTHTEPALGGLPGFSIECKARLDFCALASGIADIKSTRDASPEAFARAAYNLDYWGQAAMYRDAWATLNGGVLMPYVLVAVENKAPHLVQVYRLPERRLDVGSATYRGLLSRLAQCRKENHWPGYADGELDLELPRWAQAANEDDDDVTGLDLVVNQ